MKLDIVVARYKEPISWLSQLLENDFDISVHVYNKHEGENLLPNVGREGHTYLHHIVQNYHEIKDTIFLQGNPFDYDHEFPKNSIKNFVSDYFKKSKKVDFFAFNSNISFVDKNGYPTKRPIPLPIGAFYEKIFGEKSSPEIFEWNAGACFFVSKSRIQNIKIEKYKIMLDSLSYSNNPVEVYCLERMWKSIFFSFSKKKIKEFCKSEDGKLLSGFPKNYLDICLKDDEIKTLHQNLLGKNYLYRNGSGSVK